MNCHSVHKSIELEAVRRAERINRMRWRQRNWGQVCLSPREAEALLLEMQFKQQQPVDEEGKAVPLQKAIAGQMACTQQWVSELLRNADDIFRYFAEADVPAGWRWNGLHYVLDAPVAKTG